MSASESSWIPISVVLLVTDENCKVASSVEGTREQGIVSGERVSGGLAPLLDLNFLTKQANLQPGQKGYTSGVGGVFPSGLFIGTVKSFKTRELDGQAKLAKLSSNSKQIIVHSGHNMDLEAPDDVTAAIRLVVDAVRSHGKV